MGYYNFIVGGNSTGKTRKLLEFAKERDALVICKNAAAMGRKAVAYGIPGLRFCSYDDVAKLIQEGGGLTMDYVIDEVADFMAFFLGLDNGKLIGFTQTED